MNNKNLKGNKEVVRVGGVLKELTVVRDEMGNVIHKILSPIMFEFRLKDLLQVIVGATILAIPVAYTEEIWGLGTNLPVLNILGFLALSLIFITAFAYFNYYKKEVSQGKIELLKRIASTYIVSFLIVTFLLILIDKAPWATDWLLAFKRTVIVTLPASMSATLADAIK